MLGNDAIGFRARFGGIATDVYVPVAAVLAVYAKENGRGMVFSEDDSAPEPDGSTSRKPGKKPNLKIVK
jgi:stringent starvation protein B